MPGFNKKGPQNKGPMTGGGRGLCKAENKPLETDTQPEKPLCRQRQRRGFSCMNKNNGMGQSVGRGAGRLGNRR